MVRKLLLFPIAAAFCFSLVGRANAEVKFNRDIRPIMSDTCFHCHGPDAKARKANLRFDLRDEALKPAKSGAIAIVPGKPEKSEVVRRLFTKDTDDQMPPPEAHKTLTQQQKETFRKWIAEGAKYEAHWSYTPLVKPMIPTGRHGVDYLVEQRLQEIKLKPSPEADRRTLARRLSFDLLGLPPKAEEVDAFVNDASPDAYAKFVERLLASPHYGERMATAWLDVVRFADTIGYHSDTPRNVWPYRDYVINAFNHNKPFDQFTREQLAGDLLPNASMEAKVASAFNRLLLTTEEGGAQPKDYEARMLTDRVRAVGTVWLGQTFGCCQCHDHKFDPIKARDFYSMGAFFADIKEGIIGRREEGLIVLSDDDQRRLTQLEARVASLQREFDKPRPELVDAQRAWEQAAAEAVISESRWTTLHAVKATAVKANLKLSITDKTGLIVAKLDDKRNARGQNDGTDEYHIAFNAALKGVTGFRIQAVKEKDSTIGYATSGNFVLSEISVLKGEKKSIALARATATFEQPGFPAEAAIDGVTEQKENGWAVLGATGTDQGLYLELGEEFQTDTKETITFVLKFAKGENHEIRNLRISATTAVKPVRAPAAALPAKETAELLALDAVKRTKAQEAKLTQQFKQIAPQLAGLRAELGTAEKEKKDFETSAPHCLVSVQNETRRVVRMLPRGNWMDESGEIVQPALPSYLPKGEIGSTNLTRLDLANWIVGQENPLTARVFVNRLWKQFFGTGLSKVLEDLGTQGEPPVNPALLDWLAADFRDSGWDVKRLVRVIVNSRTYKQSSTPTKEQAARDPYNRELARQSRWRLDAEFVRDNALAISGLLVSKIGGPSMKPYQPDGYWENLNFPVRSYDASKGEDQYRRGLYTWWQRSFLHPSMLAFDAPSREECAADRARSNIPQQALVLLNDPSYVEAARAFATRIIKEGGKDSEARISWAWRQALTRSPRADELHTVRALLEKHLSEFKKNEKSAAELVKVGISTAPTELNEAELAAWTSVARVIINLHETITRS